MYNDGTFEGVAGLVNRRIDRLPGMRDVDARTYQRDRRAAEIVRSHLQERGYDVIDTPLLEETELFARKSGGELTSRLFTFTGLGGHRVSLRPEFTSSVIRHYIEERESVAVPVRWQYCGPVFRYDRGDDGGYRQFEQVGAELVGDDRVEADVEIVGLAWQVLERLGLGACHLRIGHLGVLHDLLTDYGLSEPATQFIAGNIGDLRHGRIDVAGVTARAADAGLMRPGEDPGRGASLQDMNAQLARELVHGVLGETMPPPVGRRTTDQVIARLLRKARNAVDPRAFEEAVSLVNRLARLEGLSETVIKAARGIVAEFGLRNDPLDKLEQLTNALARDRIADAGFTVDLGLARGISYYTGMVFEVMYPSSGGQVSLGGGGRYDSLVKALGADEDVPALGFAFNLDQAVGALEDAATLVSGATVA